MPYSSKILVFISIVMFPISTSAFECDVEEYGVFLASYGALVAFHELGHYVWCEFEGLNPKTGFFTTKEGKFYSGYTDTDTMTKQQDFIFGFTGEIGNMVSFELALASYRKKPTSFNKTLMYMSNYYFLAYIIQAFYLEDNNNTSDPNKIVNNSNISKTELLTIFILKCILNEYRIRSESKIQPYLSPICFGFFCIVFQFI